MNAPNSKETRSVAHEFLVGELIAAVARRFQPLALPWKKMNKAEQEGLLSEVREDVEEAVKAAVDLIAGDQRFVYRASVESVNFKPDGVKVSLSLVNTVEAHDLADRSGHTVLIVNEDGRSYLGGEDVITAEDDQGALFDKTQNQKPGVATAGGRPAGEQ